MPFAATGIRIGRWIARALGPVYQLFLRLWLSTALAIAGWTQTQNAILPGIGIEHLGMWLPLHTLVPLAGGAGFIAAGLLLPGLATRLAAAGIGFPIVDELDAKPRVGAAQRH